MFDAMLKEGILLVGAASGVPLLASAAVGLVIAIFQAATQIQDQSVSFLAKGAVACAVGFLCHGWAWSHLVLFTEELLSFIASIGHMP